MDDIAVLQAWSIHDSTLKYHLLLPIFFNTLLDVAEEQGEATEGISYESNDERIKVSGVMTLQLPCNLGGERAFCMYIVGTEYMEGWD